MTKHERIDLYQDVTNRIVEQLENGVAPWVQPWSRCLVPGLVYWY